MSQKYIFSTLSATNHYAVYDQRGELPRVERVVTITGGTGVQNRFGAAPLGVMTAVSAEDFELLEKDELFQLHKKNGFITVRDTPVDPERAAAEDMETRDGGAQKTEADFKSEAENGNAAKMRTDAASGKK